MEYMTDQLTPNYVEHPNCRHLQTIMAAPPKTLQDYQHRLVPELKAALAKAECQQCAQERAKENEGTKERVKSK